jgi:hypothetical protein
MVQRRVGVKSYQETKRLIVYYYTKQTRYFYRVFCLSYLMDSEETVLITA